MSEKPNATTTTPLAEAEALAERVLAAIDRHNFHSTCVPTIADYARERVASDLDGIKRHPVVRTQAGSATHGGGAQYVDSCQRCRTWPYPCDDALPFIAGLLRTAALYGVQP